MNNQRREKLKNAIISLERVFYIVEQALDEERDCLDNMPENLQDSDRCIKMETAIEKLEEVLEQITADKDSVDEACE